MGGLFQSPAGRATLVCALNALALVVPQGRQDASGKVRQRGFFWIGHLGRRQHPLRYLSCRQWLCGRPQHVYGAAVDGATLEPRLGWRRFTDMARKL